MIVALTNPPFQRLMAKFAETDHTEILVTDEDVANALYASMAHLDEPCGDGSTIPSFILSQRARSEVKVLLSGEGGDEVFNAYETHGAFKYRRAYRRAVPAFVRKPIASLVQYLPAQHKKLSLEFMLKRFTEGVELETPESHIYWRHPFTNTDKFKLLKGQIDKNLTDRLFRETYSSLITTEDLNRISKIDIEHFFFGDLMLKNDRMFMAHSIETRFPFMDKALVEFMTKVPPALRIKGFKRRNIQKLAMRGTIPKEILSRSNFGLELPNSSWLTKGLWPHVNKHFAKDRLGLSGLIDVDFAGKIIEEHLSQKRDHGRGLWCLLNFQIWFEIFVEKRNYHDFLVKPIVR